MRTFDHTNIQRYERMLTDVAGECRDNPETRAELDADPRAFFTERGVDVPDGMEVRVADDTADAVHLVMPPDPNNAIADDTLSGIAGGSGGPRTSTVSTVISTLSTIAEAS